MCSANLAVAECPRKGYTLVSSPSRRPILSTFLSIVAWHVISLAHSIGNQPRSPSRSLSPSYQPAKKEQRSQGTPSIWRNLDCVWLQGRSVGENFRTSILPQIGYQRWCKVRREVEQRETFQEGISGMSWWNAGHDQRPWSELVGRV